MLTIPVDEHTTADRPPSAFRDRPAQQLVTSWRGRDDEDASSVLTAKVLRLRGFSSSTRTRRAATPQIGYTERSIFTPSEAHLIESAREDILFRRRYSDENEQRQGLVCLAVMASTVFFPLIGLLALYGKFDATISWYCHGEMHCFTSKQRTAFRLQLCLEAIVYPVLITVLAVYYSVVV